MNFLSMTALAFPFLFGSTLPNDARLVSNSGPAIYELLNTNGRPFYQVRFDMNSQKAPSQNHVSPSIAPEQTCRKSRVDKNAPKGELQLWGDLSGRHITWVAWDGQSTSESTVKGYDLGPDKMFGTTDDGDEILELAHTQNGWGMSAAGLLPYPRVSHGKVVFSRKRIVDSQEQKPIVELVLCEFEDCGNPELETIVADIPFVKISGLWFPTGQFLLYDINENGVAFARTHSSNNNQTIDFYDFESQEIERVTQGYFPTPPDYNLFTEVLLDSTNLITWRKFSGTIFGSYVAVYAQHPSEGFPIELLNIDQEVPQVSFNREMFSLSSSTYTAAGADMHFTFYPRLEQNDGFWNGTFHMHRANQLFDPLLVAADNQTDEIHFRSNYHSDLNTLLLAGTSWNAQRGYEIRTALWDPVHLMFQSDKRTPFPNWNDIQTIELDQSQIVVTARKGNPTTEASIYLLDCR